MTSPVQSVTFLEREYLYLMSKADFISDFLKPENAFFPVTVTLGIPGVVCTEFMVSDLFSTEMEKTMLGELEQLFRQKAEHIQRQIKEIRKSRIGVIHSDG